MLNFASEQILDFQENAVLNALAQIHTWFFYYMKELKHFPCFSVFNLGSLLYKNC